MGFVLLIFVYFWYFWKIKKKKKEKKNKKKKGKSFIIMLWGFSRESFLASAGS